MITWMQACEAVGYNRYAVKENDIVSFINSQNALRLKAEKHWHAALREEFNRVNDFTYSICKTLAWRDEGDDVDYDELYERMKFTVSMALGIIAANNP